MQESRHQVGRTARIALAAGLLLAGCQRNSVMTYDIPKEDYTPKLLVAPKGGMGAGHGAGALASANPTVTWDKPANWEEKPNEQMRIGNFRVPGEDGKYAEVRMLPLRAGGDIEGQVISMTREELAAPDAKAKPEEFESGGLKTRLYDLTSEEAKFQGKFKARTLAAVVERGDTLWFVKMSGEESVVGKEKEAFRGFVKSLKFKDEVQVASASGGGGAGWKAPENWKEQQAGQMVLASYTTGAADISVSAFDGATGGLLANVNRWRGQVGLSPLDEGDVAKEIKTLDLADGSKASVVDVAGTSPKTGKKARLYGFIVPRGEKTWFYKILGDADAVGAEVTHLAEFAATAH